MAKPTREIVSQEDAAGEPQAPEVPVDPTPETAAPAPVTGKRSVTFQKAQIERLQFEDGTSFNFNVHRLTVTDENAIKNLIAHSKKITSDISIVE